jgi:hypothetical protein
LANDGVPSAGCGFPRNGVDIPGACDCGEGDWAGAPWSSNLFDRSCKEFAEDADGVAKGLGRRSAFPGRPSVTNLNTESVARSLVCFSLGSGGPLTFDVVFVCVICPGPKVVA